MTAAEEVALLAQGQQARLAGIPASDCPYREAFLSGDPDGRLRAVTWLRGYHYLSPADGS